MPILVNVKFSNHPKEDGFTISHQTQLDLSDTIRFVGEVLIDGYNERYPNAPQLTFNTHEPTKKTQDIIQNGYNQDIKTLIEQDFDAEIVLDWDKNDDIKVTIECDNMPAYGQRNFIDSLLVIYLRLLTEQRKKES